MMRFPTLALLLLSCAPINQSTAAPIKEEVKQTSKVVINSFKTTKGLSGWFVATPDIPVFTLTLTFNKAGFSANPKGKSGLGQLLAGLLDEGVGNRKSIEFKNYLLENNLNIEVSQSNRAFNISIRTTKEKAEEAIKVISEMIKKARFDQESLELTKEQMLNVLQQSLHSERHIAKDMADEVLFGSHPYNMPITETIKELPSITAEDLRAFLRNHCTKENAILSIAGDVNLKSVESYIDTYLGDLPEKMSGAKVLDITPTLDGHVYVKKMDIPQSYILFFHPSVSRQDPDFYAAFILNRILGDGNFESRLWNEIREKRGLAYNVDTDLVWNQHTFYLSGVTATDNKNVKEVIEIIRTQWERIQREGVTEQELDFVKKRLLGSYPLSFSSTKQIVALMTAYQYDGLGTDFINQRNNIIAAVTLDDVNRVAKKLLQTNKLTFFIVGNPEGLEETARIKP